MKSATKQRTRRSKRGTGIIELSCGSCFLIALILVALDVSVMMLGFSLNDRACRDACRAAAQQQSAAAAQQAAQAVLKTHAVDGYYVTQPVLQTGGTEFVYQDFGGNPTLGNPTVKVTTQCTVRFPVPVSFFGQTFGGDGAGGAGTMTFRKTYTFPIVTFNLVLPP